MQILRMSFIGLCSLCLIMTSASIVWTATDEKEVVVMGVGKTEEAAKQQAYRNAIQSVIGSMVLSETIVENEALVKDKILSHSDGYVVKASQVGKTQNLGDGLLEITMRVTVKSQQLQQKLKAENISVASVDGQSLFAQKTTQDEQKQDAASIIEEKLKDLPAALLVATAYPDKATQKSRGSMVTLSVPVEVTVDKDAYAFFVEDFIKTMKQLGFTPIARTLKATRELAFTNRSILNALRHNNWKNLYVIALCEVTLRDSKTARWHFFTVPKAVFTHITASVNRMQLSLALKNHEGDTVVENTSEYIHGVQEVPWQIKGNKDVIAARKFHLYANVFFPVYVRDDYGLAVIAPEAVYFRGSAGRALHFPRESDILSINMPFDLTEEELVSIQSVECVIKNVPVSKD